MYIRVNESKLDLLLHFSYPRRHIFIFFSLFLCNIRKKRSSLRFFVAEGKLR